MASKRQPAEPAATAAIEAGCRTLRLPTMRTRFAEIAARRRAGTAHLPGVPRRTGDGRMRRPHPTAAAIRRLNAAGFPRPKRLEEFDFTANPAINPATVHQLAGCEWVRDGQPLCLIGDSGTGKTHLLIALGTAAAEHGYRVKYTLASKLVNELAEAAGDRELSRTIARYGRVDLLLIDELGYLNLDRRGAELLFEVLTEREENVQHRGGLQRGVQLLDQNLHRPPALRRDRRPAHLQRPHHRNRHPAPTGSPTPAPPGPRSRRRPNPGPDQTVTPGPNELDTVNCHRAAKLQIRCCLKGEYVAGV